MMGMKFMPTHSARAIVFTTQLAFAENLNFVGFTSSAEDGELSWVLFSCVDNNRGNQRVAW
jgi:hypothetical protein